MSYGGKTWGQPAGRVRAAAKRKRKRTKTATRSRSASARRVKKKRTPKAPKVTRRKKSAAKKKARRTQTFYDVDTGKRVKVAKADYDEALADPQLTTTKPKLVYRYNPTTGRRVHVPETSTEAEEWSSKKPPKGFAGTLYRGASLGGSAGAALVGQELGKKVLRSSAGKINRAVTTIAKRGVASLGLTGVTAAGVIAAGLISYQLGKQAFYGQATEGARLDAALKNYLALKRHLVAQLGRPLTKDEARTIFSKYQEMVIRIKANDPTTYLRPGAE